MELRPDVTHECTSCGGGFSEPAPPLGAPARSAALCTACVSATARFSLVG